MYFIIDYNNTKNVYNGYYKLLFALQTLLNSIKSIMCVINLMIYKRIHYNTVY